MPCSGGAQGHELGHFEARLVRQQDRIGHHPLIRRPGPDPGLDEGELAVAQIGLSQWHDGAVVRVVVVEVSLLRSTDLLPQKALLEAGKPPSGTHSLEAIASRRRIAGHYVDQLTIGWANP